MYIDQVKTGDNIKSKMDSKGLSVMDICVKLNITPMAVYKWIGGKCLPSVDSLLVLSQILECRMEDIIITED